MRQFHIRWVIRRDMPEILEIEQLSSDHPWSEDFFLAQLRKRNCIGMVAEAGDKVVGFFVYELHSHHIDILNFAVHTGWRHQGVGSQMISKLWTKLSPGRRERIYLHVRETALDMQFFLKAEDFVAVDVCRGFYGDTGEDAYHFRYVLPSPVPEPERIT